jgi:hypothetical protein
MVASLNDSLVLSRPAIPAAPFSQSNKIAAPLRIAVAPRRGKNALEGDPCGRPYLQIVERDFAHPERKAVYEILGFKMISAESR